jgi:hypothetical protein
VTLAVAAIAAGLGSGAPAANGSTCPAPPARVIGSPPAALLSILGVLRRPASAADEPPANILANQTELYVNSVRFARTAFGRGWYVWVAGPPSPLSAGRCTRSVGVALYGLGGRSGGGGTGGGTAAQIESRGMWISIGGGTGADPARTLFAGIVPDGVATVTLHYPAGKLGGFSQRSGPALTVTGHAVNNVLVISVERAGEQARVAVTTTWRAANGTVINTLHGAI